MVDLFSRVMDLVDLFSQVMNFLFFLINYLTFLFRVGILRVIIQCLKMALKDTDDQMAQEALNLLRELPKTGQRFSTRQLVKMIGNVLLIAEAEKFKEGTRHLALEVAIMFVEAREQEPEMMGDLQKTFYLHISRLYAILLRMLSDVQWNEVKNEVEEAGQSSNYRFGEECLGRLVTTLGGNTIFEVGHRQLRSYFNDKTREWQKDFAALVALAQIAKGRSTETFPKLKQMVIKVLLSSRNLHVRPAAINAIGALSAKLVEAINDPKLASTRLAAIKVSVVLSAFIKAPDLQVEYQKRVLPALSEALKKDPNPRVTLAAIKATVPLSAHLIAAPADLQAEYQRLVLPALSEAICGFEYPQFQAASAMINISRNYPRLSPCETVGTLLEEHASSQLEIQKGENIAWHQPRITAIRKLVTLFKAGLPHDTWTALSPVQQVEFQSIPEDEI